MARGRSPKSLNAALDLVRMDVDRLAVHLRGRYWRLRRPREIRVQGVRLTLGEWWATPEIRKYIYMDRYEREERAILQKTLRAQDRYLEMGAGVGFVTTCACQRVGSERVFAYEANPRLAQLVVRTTENNGFQPTVINAALADGDGTTDFFVHEDFWTSSLKEVPGAKKIRVPTRSFLNELGRLRPTYLMVDIEGAETELLGANALPDCIRAICVETHPGAVGADAVQSMLSKLEAEGFVLDLSVSEAGVAFLSRHQAGEKEAPHRAQA